MCRRRKSREHHGSNENTNGLLRQCFPKGIDLSIPAQAALDAAAHSVRTDLGKLLDG